MFFQVNGLSFSYGKRTILRNIGLSLNRGEVVSLVGPNGAGKTTLLKCLAGIFNTNKQTVRVDGKDLRRMLPKERAKSIGYVPQHAPSSFPLSVTETVLLGRKPYIQWNLKERDMEIVQRILSDLGISHMADRYIDELSGGERQKVLLARALAQEPQMLMLDEPISALDIKHQLEVMELVKRLAQNENYLILIVLHDLEWASRYSDRVVLLKEGEIFAEGRPTDVFTEENIREVYGVTVDIVPGAHGCKITAVQTA